MVSTRKKSLHELIWLFSNSITSGNAKLLATTSKERPQMQILTDMNLNSFQKKCGMRSKNTKKVQNVSYKSLPTNKITWAKASHTTSAAPVRQFHLKGMQLPWHLVCWKTKLRVTLRSMQLLLSSCQHSVKFSYFESICLFPTGCVQDSLLTRSCTQNATKFTNCKTEGKLVLLSKTG